MACTGIDLPIAWISKHRRLAVADCPASAENDAALGRPHQKRTPFQPHVTWSYLVQVMVP